LASKNLLKKEIIAGITAFFAISYIIIVNPLILADSGIPMQLSIFATIFISIIGCLAVGCWADAPIVLAPGMGVNAFFTYTIVKNMGFSWQQGLTVSLFAGIVFALIACTHLSDRLLQVIPASLKYGITAGIGLFLVEIGLEKGSLIETGHNTIIELASLQNPAALLTILGLILSLVLYLRKIDGGFFIAIVAISFIGYYWNITDKTVLNISIANISDYRQLLFQPDFTVMGEAKFWLAVFSMSMILIFDTIGILEGILPNKDRLKKAFAVSSLVTIISSLLGTCPTVAAAESAAGIAAGARRGIMAITAGCLFAIALFFIPLLSYVSASAIAPVIIITGAMMMQQLQYVEFNDFTEWFPVFLLVVMIPLSGSISTGLAFGFIVYPFMKICIGKAKTINPIVYGLGILFFIDLFFSAYKIF